MHHAFQPFCLTLYLGGRCQLRCRYCYAGNDRPKESDLSRQAFQRAFIGVARHCHYHHRPVTLLFHGANEPLMYTHRIKGYIEAAKEIAYAMGIDMVVALTTSGVASTSDVEWASETFDYINLSWDGPKWVHDLNRPLAGSGGSVVLVETAAKIFQQRQTRLSVRATVTAHACSRLIDIVTYFKERGVRRVVLHPVYPNRDDCFPHEWIPDSISFARHFLQARWWGRMNGLEVVYPGVRIAEQHGPFCNVMQQNLVITSDNCLTGCFLVTQRRQDSDDCFMIGVIEKESIVMDERKVNHFLGQVNRGFEQCVGCVHKTHCARMCPTICPLVHSYRYTFDCSAEKIIGWALMMEGEGHPLSISDIDDYVEGDVWKAPKPGKKRNQNG